MSLSFTVEKAAENARAGLLRTPHGDLPTPAFMPVGTRATIKGVTAAQLRDLGATIVLANAYHLYLRPGLEVIRAAGGLHKFMAWHGPILTDSGGYQVFSLAHRVTISDEHVLFRSPEDGSEHRLTPERVMEIQAELGVDISMVLDHCPPGDAAEALHRAALERTDRWARRALAAKKSEQGVFGILQGGTSLALRRRHLAALRELPFDGFAIGGLGVGENASETLPIVRAIAPEMPSDRPRYLMGMGTPEDIRAAVAAGVDLFDCVLPTRNARHGVLYTSTGVVRIGNAVHAKDPNRLDPACDCPTCQDYSLAYLRHLYKASEPLWNHVASVHNLRFYLRLMAGLRAEILGQV